MEWMKQ